MNRVPFPHILTKPMNTNKGLLRFVTDSFDSESKVLYDFHHRQHNPQKDEIENVYDYFIISEVKEQRKAKGDWSAWPIHPDYYGTSGAYMGQVFESNMSEVIP